MKLSGGHQLTWRRPTALWDGSGGRLSFEDPSRLSLALSCFDRPPECYLSKGVNATILEMKDL